MSKPVAVIKTGGKQYLVASGDRLKVEKLLPSQNSEVVFDQVLLVGDGKGAKFGLPMVAGASVVAKRIRDDRAPKITVFKYKNKTRYRNKRGHRQPYTEVEITAIRGA